MTRKISRRPLAEEDLIDVWFYIAGESGHETAADRVLEKLENVMAMLADHPQAGRARPELKADLRSFPSGNYVVFYCPQPDGIEVIRVLSGYLDVQPDDLD